MIVRDEKRHNIRHLADHLGEETHCGLDARGMEKIVPPPRGEEGKHPYNFNCKKCLRRIDPSD